MTPVPPHRRKTDTAIAQRCYWLFGLVCLVWSLSLTPMSWAATLPPVNPSSPDIETELPERVDLPISDISSEKMSQFVQAYMQVVELINQRETELQQAETELESQRIQADILQAAFTKIEATGLTRQEYLQLLGLANTDAEFGERIARQLEELR